MAFWAAALPWIKAAAPVIGAVAGGLISNRGVKNQQESNEAAQREFAQYGIRWKVADAKAAGVHPLFALGQGGTVGYSPNPVVPNDLGLAEAGAHAGSAIAGSETPAQRDARLASLRRETAAAEADEAQALYYRAMAAKEMQSMTPTSPWPEHITDQNTWKETQDDASQVYNPYSDAIVRRGHLEDQIVARPLDSYDNWKGVANPRPEDALPMWSVYDTGRGNIVLPFNPEGQSLMEALEGLSLKYWPAVIAENRRRYGDAGVARIMQLYDPLKDGPAFRDVPGKSPGDAFSNMPAW